MFSFFSLELPDSLDLSGKLDIEFTRLKFIKMLALHNLDLRFMHKRLVLWRKISPINKITNVM